MRLKNRAMSKWIALGLLISFAPIWRDPSWSGGANAYEAIYYFSTREKKHIPYETAVEECRQAWEDAQVEGGVAGLRDSGDYAAHFP